MKKAYCVPIIKKVEFKAEEAVSACIVNLLYPYDEKIGVTEKFDGDDWAFYQRRWIKKPSNYLERAWGYITGSDYVWSPYVYQDQPNHS